MFLTFVQNIHHPLWTTCHLGAQVKERPSTVQLTADSFLWQEKEKEKDKIKEKEKDSKEKEKDKKALNGHAFSSIPVVGPISCSQCLKPFTNKDAYTCASKRHASLCKMGLSARESSFLASCPLICSSSMWRSSPFSSFL